MIVLQRKVTINEVDAYVFFSFANEGKTNKLNFYLDGNILTTYVGKKAANETVFLSQGSHTLKWVCKHSQTLEEEFCSISSIIIYGTSEGGASTCKSCSDGYVSNGTSDHCSSCSPGFTSNEHHTLCVACTGSTYSSVPGPCKTCPVSTIVNSNNTNCVSSEILTVNSSTFIVGNLTGIKGKISEYCNEDRFKMYCYNSLYGPTEGNDNYFYLSVLNPSVVFMPSFFQKQEFTAYAFGIINKDQLTLKEQYILEPSDSCSADISKIIVNLGSEVESLHKTANGFNLTYSNGDYCNDNSSFSTHIQFVCDKEEKEGWPIYSGFLNCQFLFFWPTIHACEVCRDENTYFSNSTCKHGQRTIHRFEGETCIFENGIGFKTWEEPCNQHHVLKTTPFIIAIVLAFVMLVLVIVTILCAWKTRGKLRRLVQYRTDGRNIELQPPN